MEDDVTGVSTAEDDAVTLQDQGASGVTDVIAVTDRNEQLEGELIAQLIRSGQMAEGADIRRKDDGIWRFADSEDKPGRTTGWCIPHYGDSGVLEAASYGTFHDDEGLLWHPSSYPALSDEEQQQYRVAMQEKKAKLAAERAESQKAARKQLAQQLDGLPPVIGHEYLQKKGVKAYGLLARGDELIIPLRSLNGELITAQRIQKDSTKRLWFGCGKKGACHRIQGDDKAILITEGYATAASLFEATGYTTLMAIDAGNLKPVALAARDHYSNSAIVICADNDQYKEKNTGVEKGKEAANEINAAFVKPEFQNVSEKFSDFNDLHAQEGVEAVRQQVGPVIEEALLRIPAGYFFKSDGLFYKQSDKSAIKVASPVKVLAMTRDENSQSWGRWIELIDADGASHCFSMSMKSLQGRDRDYLNQLSDLGLVCGVDSDRLLAKYLTQCAPVNRVRCVDKFGWYERSFVLPEGQIGEAQEQIVFQSPTGVVSGSGPKGTLDEWRSEVASLCVGNSRLLFGVSAAFAASILALVGGEPGGFHFRCGSSRGKTTLLLMAQSVWKNPEEIQSWRATDNGLEGVAVRHNHMLLCLDEFSQLVEKNPQMAGDAIYMLGNGKAKQRSNRKGQAVNCREWLLYYLSSGEVSLKSVFDQSGKSVRAGHEVRFVDIPADAGQGLGVFDTIQEFDDGGSFADAIKERSKQYYGTAAREFIQALAGEYERYQVQLQSSVERIKSALTPNECDAQVERVVKHCAIVAAAGELASEMGITGWDTGLATWAAEVCLKSWLDERGGTGSHEAEQAVAQVRGKLQQNQESKFAKDDGSSDRQLSSEDCRVRNQLWGVKGSECFYIFPWAFEREICSGLDPKFVAKQLQAREMLVHSPGRLQKSKRVNGTPTWLYALSDSILGDQDAEELCSGSEENVSTMEEPPYSVVEGYSV